MNAPTAPTPSAPASDDATALAERLLEAQVRHLAEALTGADAASALADDLVGLVDALADVPVAELVDRSTLVASATQVAAAVGTAPGVAALVRDLAVRLRDLPANAVHDLGDVVPRERLEPVVTTLAGSDELREEALRRIAASPRMANLALRFVSALVEDTVAQNRQRAEKVPGMKSLLGVGDFAARQARGLVPGQIENLVGGVADAGAGAAMQRVLRAIDAVLDPEVLAAAVMELLDQHAGEPVAALRAYLSTEQVRAVAEQAAPTVGVVATTPWFAAVVEAAVDGFLAAHGDATVRELLDAHGVDDELLRDVVVRHAPAVLAQLRADGRLEPLLRRRLEPFWTDPATLALLDAA